MLLLHLSVFFELLCDLKKFGVKLFSGIFAISHKLLILGNVFLEVVKDLELFVESNQSVQLMLEFHLFLFQSKLELVFLALIEHGFSETLGCARADSCRGRSGFTTVTVHSDRFPSLRHRGSSPGRAALRALHWINKIN